MYLNRSLFGTINIPDGLVDVTDPCYDSDVWCRETFEVFPGKYKCFGYFSPEDCDYGRRCFAAQILLAQDKDNPDSITPARSAAIGANNEDKWEEIGEIGVDAGVAGFFSHKPDFNDEEWDKFCDFMRKKDARGKYCAYRKKFATGDGFWTESGLGDGCYPVYAKKYKGQIVGLEIRFG